MSKKNRGFNEAFILNNRTLNFHKMRCKLLSNVMFEWEGLPDGIPSRFIENVLYNDGIVGIAFDKLYGYVACRICGTGKLNLYDEYDKYIFSAPNGYNKTFSANECVIIRNNSKEIPTKTFALYFAKKLYEIDRTIDTNIILQKTSKILMCSEEQRLSLENLLMKYEGNIPFILGYKSIDADTGIKASSLDLNAPYVADKLQELKNDIWREFLDFVGINNANTSKKERLITSEVNSNNQLLELSNDIFYNERLKACRELNKKFGLEIKVIKKGGDVDNDNTPIE